MAFAGAIAAPLALATSSSASAAQLRVIHAAPDAPPVDIWRDGAPAITDLAFASSSGYAALPAATHSVQVVPAGATEPVVIDADLAVENGMSSTVLAGGRLADIEPLVLVDDSTLDAERGTRALRARLAERGRRGHRPRRRRAGAVPRRRVQGVRRLQRRPRRHFRPRGPSRGHGDGRARPAPGARRPGALRRSPSDA